MVNILDVKTIEEREVALVEDIKKLGEVNFEMGLTPQAKKIISQYGKEFPLTHFKTWWLKNFSKITGMQLHMYFSVENGFEEGVR